MKISITPTDKTPNLTSEETQHSATVEHPFDDITVTEAFELFARALVAYGFHHKNVKDCLEESLGKEIFGGDELN